MTVIIDDVSAAANLGVQAAVSVALATQVQEPSSGIAVTTMEAITMIEVGMKYPSMLGPVTVTSADLVDAVESGKDPTIPRGRLGLGHTDPRFNDPTTYDAIMAFGKMENLRLAESGMALVADLVDVPVWLASVAPYAWPNRSIEAWTNWTAVSGKNYRWTLYQVKLLGIVWPACMTMEDLETRVPAMYGATQPGFVEVLDRDAMVERGIQTVFAEES